MSLLASARESVVCCKILQQKQRAENWNDKVEEGAGTPAPSKEESDLSAKHDLTFVTALWLATQGGAEALNFGDQIGSFAVGKHFDAILCDPSLRKWRQRRATGESEVDKAEGKLPSSSSSSSSSPSTTSTIDSQAPTSEWICGMKIHMCGNSIDLASRAERWFNLSESIHIAQVYVDGTALLN